MDMVMLNAAEELVQSGSCLRNEVEGSDYIHEQRGVDLFPPLPATVMSQYYGELPRCSPDCKDHSGDHHSGDSYGSGSMGHSGDHHSGDEYAYSGASGYGDGSGQPSTEVA